MNILYILYAILIFGFLIFIHELGHFLVARRCGVEILEFSIGFGPVLVSKRSRKSGTLYALRLLPLGGYVNMLGETGMEVVQGSSEGETLPEELSAEVTTVETVVDEEKAKRAYCNKSVWQRILISLAGPLMNLVLGFLLMFGMVCIQGAPAMGSTNVAAFYVEYTAEEPAFGFLPGDNIYSIDGKYVSSFANLKKYVAETGGSRVVTVTVQRYDEEKNEVLKVDLGEVTLTSALLDSNFRGSLSEGNGENALKIGDEIVKVNSTPVHTYAELSYEMMNQGHKPLRLTVIRNGEKTVIENVQIPQYVEQGATFGMPDFRVFGEKVTFGSIIKHSFYRSISTVKMVYDSIFGLFSGRYGVEAVTGPVGITKTIAEVAQTSWLNVLHLFIVISINLGVMNLLPVPGLDGGHILIYFIEIIRRKPMKKELEGVINFIGLLLLLTLAVVITIKDVIAL